MCTGSTFLSEKRKKEKKERKTVDDQLYNG